MAFGGCADETPKGSRNKFDYDPESNLFMVGGLLPEGMMFPLDFGFIPSKLGDDGEPLDVMVLMDAPGHAGCPIDVRIIGVIEAEQTQDGKTEKNSRLLGASVSEDWNEGLTRALTRSNQLAMGPSGNLAATGT